MATFEYRGIDAQGKAKNGKIEASSLAGARAALVKSGVKPLIVKPFKKKNADINIGFLGGGVKTKHLVIFTRQLSTMVSAGVSLTRSLATLQAQTESATLKEVLSQVQHDVESGESFADSLAKHPKVFNTIYVNMVRAGETGGILDEILKKLSVQQEKDAAVKGKIRGAMTYPSVIFGITMIAFFFLMTTIVPQIGEIIVSLGGSEDSLPVYTKALLAISEILQNPIFIVSMLVIVPFAFFMFRRYTKTPAGRLKWHGIVLKIPIVKTLVSKVAIARFARTFASLNGAGVSIIQALDVTAGAIGNAVIEKELLDTSRAVQSGEQLSKQLEKSQFFPQLVAQMMAVGEETGQTSEILVKVAEFYEEEVDTFVGSLSSIIEPLMIVVMGSIVGVIAASVFGPISNISSNIQ
jgi:type IV pilus assembly protein PilC